MKKVILLLSVFIAVSTISCFKVRMKKIDNADSIPVVTTSQIMEEGEALSKKIEAGESLIIELEKGEKVKVTFDLKVPAARFEAGDSYLIFDEKVYFLISKEGYKISRDKVNWADLNEESHRTVKAILDVAGGSFNASFGITEENGTLLHLELEAQ